MSVWTWGQPDGSVERSWAKAKSFGIRTYARTGDSGWAGGWARLAKQPVQILASLLGNLVGDLVVGKTCGEFSEQLANFLLCARRPSVRRVMEEGNGLLFGAELAFVANEAILVDVA